MKNISANIRNALKGYITENKICALVLGLSGGIDSALVAALASPVCESLDIPLIGRSIAIETNKPDEIERGMLIGNCFCADFKALDLTNAYHNLLPAIEESVEGDERKAKIRRGNLKARMRMLCLYDLAQFHKGMVLSTDNYTEYLLGFWTLHGDVGDYGMIQNLWKGEVYELARFLCENELKGKSRQTLLACCDAVPTDGLGITSSDLEQLEAATYEEVDTALKNYPDNNKSDNKKVIARHLSSSYKRNNPFNLSRKKIFG